ncbi:MAG: hypothetical protein ACLTDM_11200 [Clostridium butyricum]
MDIIFRWNHSVKYYSPEKYSLTIDGVESKYCWYVVGEKVTKFNKSIAYYTDKPPILSLGDKFQVEGMNEPLVVCKIICSGQLIEYICEDIVDNYSAEYEKAAIQCDKLNKRLIEL